MADVIGNYVTATENFLQTHVQDKLVRNPPGSQEDNFEGETKQETKARLKVVCDALNNVAQQMQGAQQRNPNMNAEQAQKFQSLVSRFNALYELYIAELEKYNALKKKPVISMGDITPNSGWSDIPLSVEHIATIKVHEYVAKSTSCEYYLVNIDGQDWIMRLNVKDESDEVALVPKPSGPMNAKNLQAYIAMSERSNSFQDIEIQGSKPVGLSAGVGTAAGAAAGAGYGMVGGIPGVIGGAIVGGTVGVASTLWDKDFTTENAKTTGLYAKCQQVKSYSE